MPSHDDEYAARTYEDASLEAKDAQNATVKKSSAPGVETRSVLRKSPQMETLSSAGVRQQSLPMDPAAGDIRRRQKTQKVSGSHPRPAWADQLQFFAVMAGGAVEMLCSRTLVSKRAKCFIYMLLQYG